MPVGNQGADGAASKKSVVYHRRLAGDQARVLHWNFHPDESKAYSAH